MATIAFELVEQLGRAPGAVVAPVGHGSLVLGLHLGFQSMCAAGVIDRMPRLIGVQALACAPIWAVSTSGAAGLGFVREGATLAEGVRILHPVRGDAVLAAVEGSGGAMEAVAEDEIAQAQRDLACVGLLIEPTSALIWPAALKRLGELDDPVVAVLTGSGFKAMPV
jgi:threonine synthase